MQWKHVNSPPSRKFCTQRRLLRHGHNFLGLKGVLLVDYLPDKTTMTGPYYGEVLTNLRQAVKEKRRGMLTRRPLLLQGNAPANMSRVAQAISQGHRIRAAVSPTLLTRPDTQRLLPISTSEGTRFFDDDEL